MFAWRRLPIFHLQTQNILVSFLQLLSLLFLDLLNLGHLLPQKRNLLRHGIDLIGELLISLANIRVIVNLFGLLKELKLSALLLNLHLLLLQIIFEPTDPLNPTGLEFSLELGYFLLIDSDLLFGVFELLLEHI